MNPFLTKIYLYRFLDAFKLIGVIFALFFSQSGLNPFQISLLITIWSVTTIVTEVPMGVFADTYSRRNLLVMGTVLLAVGLGFWLRGGFTNYAIGFVLWGLKNTLTSGTLEAFVYDELVAFQKEKLYEKVSGKMSGAFSFGLVLSAIIGGIIAQIGFTLVIVASIVTTLLAGVVLLTIRQVKAIQSTGETKYYSIVKLAVQQIRNNPSLLTVIMFICIVFAAFGASDEYWSLIYEHSGLNVSIIGVLVAVVYGISSLAGYTIGLFERLNTVVFYCFVIGAGILFMIFGIGQMIILLPLAFLGIYLYQVASIKLEAEMQRHIASSQRATISSIKSLLFELTYMGMVLLFGFVGKQYGVMMILPVVGVIVIFSTGGFLLKNWGERK